MSTTTRTTDAPLKFLLPDAIVSAEAGETTIDLTSLASVAANTFPDLVTFSAGITVADGPVTIAETGAPALILTGTPAASATSALIRVGSAPVGGSAAGTYYTINAGAGFTGDFARFQVNGSSVFSVTYQGGLSFGAVNLGTTASTARSAIVANILCLCHQFTDMRGATAQFRQYAFGANTGFISEVLVTLDGALLTADASLTITNDGAAMTFASTTIPLVGSAEGTTLRFIPTGGNAITALSRIKVLIAGGNTAAVSASITVKAVY